MTSNILLNPIENWFEERLALDQEHKMYPEKRMVCNNTSYFATIIDHLVY